MKSQLNRVELVTRPVQQEVNSPQLASWHQPSSKRARLVTTSSPQEEESASEAIKECLAKLDQYCQKVLDTPVITRRRPQANQARTVDSALKSISKRLNAQARTAGLASSTGTTPQSILKSRGRVGGRGQESRESTPGKSLRFNVPKSLPPPTFALPSFSSDEDSELEKAQEIDPEKDSEDPSLDVLTPGGHQVAAEPGPSVSAVFGDATIYSSPPANKPPEASAGSLGDETKDWIEKEAERDLAENLDKKQDGDSRSGHSLNFFSVFLLSKVH